MRKLLLLGAGLFVLAACDAPVSSENTQTKKPVATVDASMTDAIETWLEDKFMENVKRSPMFMAQMGIKERTDEWDDVSRAAKLKEIDDYKTTLEELRSKFDRTKLSKDRQLSFDMMERFLTHQIEDDKYWDYGYSFNQMFGAHSQIPTFMKNQHPIETAEDAENYIKRLHGIKGYLGEIVTQSQASAEKGIMPPKFVYGHVLRDGKNITSGAPFDDSGEDSIFLADFKGKLAKTDIDDAKKSDLIARAEKALLRSVRPAYRNFMKTMRAQQKIASDDDGAWKLPNGADYYAHRLKRMTTTDMSADEIHDLGLREVDRIHGEMREIMKKVGFEGTLQEFFVHLKTDPKFVYEDSDEGRAAYIRDAAAMIDTIEGNLKDYFSFEPATKLEVRAVEAFREKSAGKAFYNRPAMDGSRPGIYYANLYKITDMPKYQMEALAYHEGIPGHHMQFAVTQKLDIPRFQRFSRATAHSEGWGLYSEYLPKEMGYYTDPYSDFGRLAMELWRAGRLVVDTGLHHKKWTRQEAIDYLLTNTPNPENDCVKAIERYIVMPGQATAYKIGMNKILELREMSKKKLGKKFDIKEFHDVVLGSGPIPLSILEQQVNNWISSKS